MRNPWLGYVIFIPLFTATLIFLALIFPENNSMGHFLNRILPLEGKILGQEPEAWLGDITGKRVGGKGGQNRSSSVDVDYIKVRGRWYKIKGPVYITRNGKVFGWHQETPFEETGYIGRWVSSLK